MITEPDTHLINRIETFSVFRIIVMFLAHEGLFSLENKSQLNI